MQFLVKNWFLIGLLLLLIVGFLAPDIGIGISAGSATTNILIVLIFLITGYTLPSEAVKNGLREIKLHLFLQIFIFAVVPLYFYLTLLLLPFQFSAETRIGIFALAVLPTTIFSCVLFTQTAGGNTVAVRMPSHPLALELIRRSGTPVAAPSANLFGKTSPTTAGHVADQLAGRYAVLIDGGACRVGVESTVLSLAGDRPRVLRPGGITAEDIAEIAGPIASGPVKETTQTLGSPGLLPSHYAPATPMLLVDDASEYAERKDIAVILREPTEKVFAGNVFVLSSRNDLRGAAAMLYQTLRLVDRMNFCLIVAERFPQEGIGVAVNDRLTRAAAATPEKV